MTERLSFPKAKISVLLLENIHANAASVFEGEGYRLEVLPGALDEAELAAKLPGVHLLGIRSNTRVTAKALEGADRLLAIGAFCIGTNQIDLPAATARGVAVFNAPFSNTRSVVELVAAEIIALSRRLTDRNAATHRGEWDKSAVGSHEVRGRKLGIVGYGHIGSQLSVLAESLGMKVYYYDVADRLAFGNAKACATLEELLAKVDVLSVHVDGRPDNRALFGEAEFAQMREGALFLNLSRGTVVDAKALRAHLVSGHLAGAAIDVFETEPKRRGEKFVSVLQNLPNVILTPHVAAGTEEAQSTIGNFVAGKLVNFINTGSTAMSVNLPELALPGQKGRHRLIWIHRNNPGVLANLNTLLAKQGVNVDGQFLGTSGDVGYVITDISKQYPDDLMERLRALPDTVRLRALY